MLFSPQVQRVFINDVAVRDGFQIEANFIPTEEKIRLIDQLSHTGLKKIEITSFVSPKATHNLANMRMEPAQSLQRFRNVMDLLAGSAVKAHATIATAFGCPFEGAQS